MKTIAIRLDEEQHAQLSIVAQLEGSTITDLIRQAIEDHLTAKRSQPELAARAEAVLADIDAEAANRRSAIATLFGSHTEGTGDDAAQTGSRGRRKTTSE